MDIAEHSLDNCSHSEFQKRMPRMLYCTNTHFYMRNGRQREAKTTLIKIKEKLIERMKSVLDYKVKIKPVIGKDDQWFFQALSAAKSLLAAALDWLADPRAPAGATGEKAIRRICDYSERIAARALPEDSEMIYRVISDINSMTNAICELRSSVSRKISEAERRFGPFLFTMFVAFGQTWYIS